MQAIGALFQVLFYAMVGIAKLLVVLTQIWIACFKLLIRFSATLWRFIAKMAELGSN